jgi:hypothetical protein
MLAQRSTLTLLRIALLAILLIGLAGIEVELFLIKHTEGAWELTPILLVALAIVIVAWCAWRPTPSGLRALQATMLLFLLNGIVGVFIHLRANVSWEHESNPSLGGSELYMKALMGATPLLAPGTMIQLGLVGLAFAFRHPAFAGSDRTTHSNEET